jgi:O-antigen/teichoic acid export membrane protein
MKSVGKQTLIYGLGLLLGKGVGLMMLPIYTRYLTPADYGVLELIEMTLELVSIVAGAQLALGVFRFYHKAETSKEKQAVVSTALIALSTSYGLVGLAGLIAAPTLSTLVFGSSVHTTLIRIASASLAFQSLSMVPYAYSRMRDRPVHFVTMTLVRTVIALTLNVVFLIVLGLGVKSLLMSSLIANLIVGVWLSAQLIREVGLGFSRQATRDLLRYGIPMIATQLATFVVTFGDRYFLLASSDATVVGLYTLGYQFGFLVALFGAGPFMRVWDPRRFSVADRPDRDEIYSQGFIYLNLLLITIALITAVFIQDLLRIMVTPAFYAAAHIVPVVLIAYVLQSWTAIQDIGILIRERTKYIMIGNWVAALTALAGYALLVPHFLAWGAAIATVAAFAVRHVIIFSISQRLCRVQYRWGPVLRLVGIALVTYAVSRTLPQLSLGWSIAARTLLMLGYVAAMWRMNILSDSDRAFVRRIRATVLLRLRLAGVSAKAAQNA